MKRLLITGSGSKFTRLLIEQLAERLDQIYLLSRVTKSKHPFPNVFSINFNLLQSDSVPLEVDTIIHLAAIVPYNKLSDVDIDVYTDNIVMFKNMMQYAVRSGVKRVLFLSSTDIYPLFCNDLITSTSEPAPHNEYGLSKLACERIGFTIAELESLCFSVIRLGPIYTEDDSGVNAVSCLLQDLRNNRPIEIHGKGNIFSPLHVESAVEAIVAALTVPSGCFLVTGNAMTMEEFFRLAIVEYASESKIRFTDKPTLRIQQQFDLGNTEQALGWKPYVAQHMFNRFGSKNV